MSRVPRPPAWPGGAGGILPHGGAERSHTRTPRRVVILLPPSRPCAWAWGGSVAHASSTGVGGVPLAAGDCGPIGHALACPVPFVPRGSTLWGHTPSETRSGGFPQEAGVLRVLRPLGATGTGSEALRTAQRKTLMAVPGEDSCVDNTCADGLWRLVHCGAMSHTRTEVCLRVQATPGRFKQALPRTRPVTHTAAVGRCGFRTSGLRLRTRSARRVGDSKP